MNALSYLLMFIAGALTVLAFAPYNYSLLPFFTLAILFANWLEQVPGKAASLGYAFGFGLLGVGTFWLHVSIDQFGGVAMPLAMLLAVLFAAFMALFYALAGWLSSWLAHQFSMPRFMQLFMLFPSVWVLMEIARGYFLTGFPWLSMGYSQLDSVLAGLAPVLGVFGVSWLVVLVSSGLVFILRTPSVNRQLFTVMSIALVFVLSYKLTLMQWNQPAGEKITVRIVQGNVPQAVKWHPDYRASSIDLYQRLSFEQAADLVVWPETAVPAFANHVEQTLLSPLQEKLQAAGVQMIIGIPVKNPEGHYFNSMISLGSERDRYDKRHLVPFGEYAPLEFLLRPLVDFFAIPMSDFRPGEADKPLLKVGGYQAGVSICYEDAFGNETAQALPDAAYLVNISNDAWFGDSLAPYQHLEIARMRAIESGRYLVRATNTGISALIDDRGRVIDETKQAETVALQGEIKPLSGLTVYSRYGDWLITMLMALLMLPAIVISLYQQRR